MYLSPILNNYLLLSNIKINKFYNKAAYPGDCGHYVPYNWVPHVAVATKMNDDEMRIAFQVVQNEFQVFQGVTDRIVLVECNSYKEIKVWKL